MKNINQHINDFSKINSIIIAFDNFLYRVRWGSIKINVNIRLHIIMLFIRR